MIDRAFALLRSFYSEHRSQSLAQVARRTGPRAAALCAWRAS
ncbi:helix-turn-helix domain-containing protein [Streptomyces mirabilis]